ncbi:lipopolysaccharide biosynthesis protein [Methylorubrum zatmanii]|uniref:Lipopolysaccharide biosynthesis protein n=1 Tax=Methylorubrum zatmanii TaxID=29429 RepID=A0ABW1WLS2_9HYPH|nr:lipopolysaccharide biosynthesis protein [Methylorubrum zatmanii]MBD8906749.1 polysaccharide biosynthesis protein [Methylorubrum zatmanii]
MAADKAIAATSPLDPILARLRAVRATAAVSALGVFAIRIAAAGFAYGAQVLMARMMGGAEYGIFATVWVWIAILGHTATFGLSQGACRFLPADQATGRLDRVRGFLLGGALASLGGGLALSLGGLAVALLRDGLLAGPYGTPILVAALVVPLFAFQDYLEGVARSQGWPLLAIAPPYLLRQGLIMVTMAGAVLGGAPAEAWIAIACTLAATGLAATLQAALLLLRLRRHLPAGPRRYAWRLWLTACLPIAAGDLAASAFGFVDVVILGFLVPPEAVGLYFAATRIQQFVAFVHYAASAATAQRLAAARARGDEAGLAGLVRRQARWTFLATAGIGLAILAVSPLLLGLFGEGFRGSLPVLAILVAGSVAASLFGPAEDVLTMLGGERLCAGITLAMLALAALLCLALVPWLGVSGAAAAVAVAAVLRGLAMALGARAIHGLATPVVDVFPRGAAR